MVSFENDYNIGAHPAVLQRLMDTNMDPQTGYGHDTYCAAAKDKIKNAFGCPDADVYFTVGGTQTNALVIDTVLRPYEGVIAADTGHVAAHEAGAIEYTGHKVLTLPHHEGKLCAAEVEGYVRRFYADENHTHMVAPGMVYISHPTEYGTLYTKEELKALSSVCRKAGIPLYMDGARLGYGLMSYRTDLAPKDIADLCDIFYIGGTKVGALCGEAVVFAPGRMPEHFATQVKQHGGMLAKGRLLGVQFDALFTDNLYFSISRHAIDMAEKLKAVCREKGIPFYLETDTNQQFFLLEDTALTRLQGKVVYSFWEKPDDTHTIIRLCTSWGTTEDDIAALRQLL